MARVYFHYHDGVDRILDLEGADLTLEQSRARALGEVRALIAHDALIGRIEGLYGPDRKGLPAALVVESEGWHVGADGLQGRRAGRVRCR